MLDRLKSLMGGVGGPTSEVMSVDGEEPCEDCGTTPADHLVGVRWMCSACAPAARRAEGEQPDPPAAGEAGPDGP